jgi:hypothetical protein
VSRIKLSVRDTQLRPDQLGDHRATLKALRRELSEQLRERRLRAVLWHSYRDADTRELVMEVEAKPEPR